jgi:anti-sigma B factor antagonist
VSFITSAGYRVLLVVYRAVTGKGGRAVLVGLTEDIKDTLRVIGFLDFFTHHETLEAGVAGLLSGGV